MNLNRAEAVALAQELAQQAEKFPNVDLAVCPPFVYLEAVSQVVKSSKIGLGAQNLYFEKNGAFTGEISAAMLVDLGCQYVIVGHSERRHVMGETDQQINQKVLCGLQAGLTVIFCVGELLAERQAGKTKEVIKHQFEQGLANVKADQMAKVVIAYEPVWAIGTGQVATPQQAEEVHLDLRNFLEGRYNAEVAAKVCIQYGGSVKPDNAQEIMAQPNVDGALVGGASLKTASFLGIAEKAG